MFCKTSKRTARVKRVSVRKRGNAVGNVFQVRLNVLTRACVQTSDAYLFYTRNANEER